MARVNTCRLRYQFWDSNASVSNVVQNAENFLTSQQLRACVCVCVRCWFSDWWSNYHTLPPIKYCDERKKKDFASLVSDKHFQILFPIEVTPKLNSLLFRSHFFGRRVFDASSDGRCVLWHGKKSRTKQMPNLYQLLRLNDSDYLTKIIMKAK